MKLKEGAKLRGEVELYIGNLGLPGVFAGATCQCGDFVNLMK